MDPTAGDIVHASEDRTKDDSGTAGTWLDQRADDPGFDRDSVGTSPASRQGPSARRAKIALAGLIVVFVTLGTFIAIKTPAYESADEPGHVQNIETLVSGNWYGMKSSCRFSIFEPAPGLLGCQGDEAHQAPLYYLALAGWQRLVDLPARAPYRGPFAPSSFQTRAHGPAESFPAHSPADHRFLLWLRIPNVLLGALTVLFAYFAVRIVSTDPWTPVVGASMVAFLPRFVFLSSFVTNDNLVNLLGAVLTFFALRYARTPGRGRIAVVGAVVGLLLITKLSALPIAIVLVPLAFMATGWKRRAESLGIGVIAALGISGWYLIQNTVRYGDPLARAASSRYLAQLGGLGTFLALPYKAGNPLSLVFVRVPERIFNGFWYQSGWNQFHWSWPVNLLFSLVLAVALVGLVHRHVDPKALVTSWTIAIAGFLSVWVVATQTSTYQARYAFVGLAAIAALAALGLERWKLPVRFLLPAMGLCGTLIAIQQNVLAIHWSS
jgi:Dolichyl-phosphate-mannose-protein mannosyltransferase